MRLALLLFLSAALAPAGYVDYYTDSFHSFPPILPAEWTSNGAISAGSFGLTATSPQGGSLISKRTAAPGNANYYEVNTLVSLQASGGTYIQYLRATPDAMSGPAAQGTYYSVELQNPIFNGSACTARLALTRRSGGQITELNSAVIACSSAMTMRSILGAEGLLMV